jgi:glucokinase
MLIALFAVLVVVDGIDEERTAAAGKVKRLGDDSIVTAFSCGGGRVEFATDHPYQLRLASRLRQSSKRVSATSASAPGIRLVSVNLAPK